MAMNIVIPGGTGYVGRLLARAFRSRGDKVIILSRTASRDTLVWDGKTLGPWATAIEGADAVINLAGRSVNCRYTRGNLDAMMSSRVDSARIMGEAIAKASRPPRVWLQMSTATIYAHTFGPANDEVTGVIGGSEPDVPRYWDFSIAIAKAWERELENAQTPKTRKVAMRTAMVMSPDSGGVFWIFATLARLRLAGPQGGGRQFMSWIHDRDFVRAVDFLIGRDDLSGPINLAAPNPLSQREFLAELRRAIGVRAGLPSRKWMLEIAAFVHRTDTELLLKSRRVIPRRLLESGFVFEFPRWSSAVHDLVTRRKDPRRDSGLYGLESYGH
jgi:uncharacterized protein (TIGR01777 family)